MELNEMLDKIEKSCSDILATVDLSETKELDPRLLMIRFYAASTLEQVAKLRQKGAPKK